MTVLPNMRSSEPGHRHFALTRGAFLWMVSTMKTSPLLPAIDAAGGAGFGDDDFHEQRQLGL